jgi:hypothetical protein
MADNKKLKRSLSPKQQRDRYIKQVKRRARVLQRNNGRHINDALNNRLALDSLLYECVCKEQWISNYNPLMSDRPGVLLIFGGNEPVFMRADDNKVWSVIHLGGDEMVIRSGYHPGRRNKGYVLCKKGHEFKGFEVKV